MKNYSKNWKRPQVYKDLEKAKEKVAEIEPKEIDGNKVIELFEPKGAQIEALYELENSRKEDFDKGLVVAATGVGKTYLAAFDSIKAKRVLFVEYRKEIINQAAKSFKNVRKDEDIDFSMILVRRIK